jgi:hypothetical protein
MHAERTEAQQYQVLQLLDEAAYHRLLIVVVSWLKNILSIVLEASPYMVRYV